MLPPIIAIMAMNRKTKGRSSRVVSVAEVKNSRSDSNSRSSLANAPAEGGRCGELHAEDLLEDPVGEQDVGVLAGEVDEVAAQQRAPGIRSRAP